MSVRLKNLTADDVRIERERFPRVFSATPRELAVRWLVWGGTAVILLYGLYHFGFFSERFVHGFTKLGVMAAQLFPPAGWQYMPQFLHSMAETLAMAFLGTLIGATLAIPLGFLASKNMLPVRVLQFGFRRFSDVLRSADYLIWALIFVRAIGLGPLPGIMAIAIVDTGTLTKLYSEAIENIDRRQIEGIRASGGNWYQVVRFGVLPQVLPVMLSNALYMFESNTRAATILGIVGAGGIGFELSDALRAFEFDRACLIIIMIIVVVYFIDFFSKRIRERFIRGDSLQQGTDESVTLRVGS